MLDDQLATFKQIEAIAKDQQVDAIVIAGDLYDRSVPNEAAVGLNDFSLLDDQLATFKQIEAIAKDQQVDAIVIAGDLYDRSVPNEAAVGLLKQMLQELNLTDHFPLLEISGNHDTAVRLSTGTDWFAYQSFFLNTNINDAFTPVTIKDTQFFLLPFFGIQEVRNYFNDDKIKNVNDAMARITAEMEKHFPVTIKDTQFFLLPFFGIQEVRNYFNDDKIKNVNDAMARITAEMEKHFAPGKRHVLVAHFFAAGSKRTADSETLIEIGGLSAVTTDVLAPFDYVALGHLHNRNALNDEKAGSKRTADSETLIEIGGLSAVTTDVLAPFDYVALGHLHNRNALNDEKVKYSGSPMKFSVSEAKQEKGVWIVDTAPFKAKWVPLSTVHDIHLLKGSFAELATKPEEALREDFYDIELTDQERIPDVLNKLRELKGSFAELATKPEEALREDFYDIELTDQERIPDVLNKLREYYPKIVSLHRTHQAKQVQLNLSKKRAQESPLDLLTDFYSQTMGNDLTDRQKKWAEKALTQIMKGEE